MKLITDTIRDVVRLSFSAVSHLAPWAPNLASLDLTDLKSVLRHHHKRTQALSHEELVALTRVTLWWSLFMYGVPFLLVATIVMYLAWKARFRCREMLSRRPQWLMGKFLLHFTSALNFVLTLSTILAWTQQRSGFPRSFFEWILKPVYITLDFFLGPSIMEFATQGLGINIVPLVLSLLCTRFNRKLQVWMLRVREWDDGEGWVAPGRYPPVQIDLGNPKALRKLIAMGFDEHRAERALALANNDIDMAAARLLEQR